MQKCRVRHKLQVSEVKKTFKKLANKLLLSSNQESGYILAFALIIFALVAIMIGPLLDLMSSGLKQGTAIEFRTDQTYIADAGIESACQKILTGNLDNITDKYDNYTYISNDVNFPGSKAVVTITYIDDNNSLGYVYEVESVGINENGESTTITANIIAETGIYYSFLDNIATTQGDLTIPGGNPNVTLSGTVQAKNPPPETINFDEEGGYNYEYKGLWPDADELRSWYGSRVDPTSSKYHASGWTFNSPTELTGITYVKGDLEIDDNLTLNGFAVFVDGNIVSKPNSFVIGPGVVVATGTIVIQPNTETGEDGILIVSVYSEPPLPMSVDAQPNGTFYGWIVGYNGINFQPNTEASWVPADPSIFMSFPGLIAKGPRYPTGRVSIANWNITSQ